MHMYKRGRLIKIILKLYGVIAGLAAAVLALTRGRSNVLYKLEDVDDSLLVTRVLCVSDMVLVRSVCVCVLCV